MRPIPIKLRKLLNSMPRMHQCELYLWDFGPCEGRITWHHVWVYGGTQCNEHWAILGACERHHDMVKTDRKVKEAFERRSLEIATDEELKKYPNKDWKQLKIYLRLNKIS